MLQCEKKEKEKKLTYNLDLELCVSEYVYVG